MFPQRVGDFSCDILAEAIKRYERVISLQGRVAQKHMVNITSNMNWRSDPLFEGFLSAVTVHLKQPCEKLPYLNMDESCKY